MRGLEGGSDGEQVAWSSGVRLMEAAFSVDFVLSLGYVRST